MADVFRLQVKTHFDAAHQLVGYKGKCARLHGHRWDVEVCLEGSELDNLNMLVDFGNVKKVVNELLDGFLDHYFLNDALQEPTPTAEFLAKWIYEQVQARIIQGALGQTSARLVSTGVWESPDCCVKYRNMPQRSTGESPIRIVARIASEGQVRREILADVALTGSKT